MELIVVIVAVIVVVMAVVIVVAVVVVVVVVVVVGVIVRVFPYINTRVGHYVVVHICQKRTGGRYAETECDQDK